MGSREEGARGWGGAYWFVVVSGRACSVMGKTEKRELRPRGLRVGGCGQLSARLLAAGQGARVLGEPLGIDSEAMPSPKQPL